MRNTPLDIAVSRTTFAGTAIALANKNGIAATRNETKARLEVQIAALPANIDALKPSEHRKRLFVCYF